MHGAYIATSGWLGHPNRMRCRPGNTDVERQSSLACRRRIDFAAFQSDRGGSTASMLTSFHVIAVGGHRLVFVSLQLLEPRQECGPDVAIYVGTQRKTRWRLL